MRKVAALAVVLGAAFAAYWLVVAPWRCNIVSGEVSRSTAEIAKRPDSYTSRGIAAANDVRLRSCFAVCPTDVQLAMVAASNFVILGRRDAAIAMYERALRYDRRPELHLALAIAQIEGHRDRKAIVDNLVLAGEYGDLDALKDVPDLALQNEAVRIVGLRREAALAKLGKSDTTEMVSNGSFETADEIARVVAAPAATVDAPARGWRFRNAGSAPATCELVASPRGSGRALHVVTNREQSRIVQSWPKIVRSRVVTTAWVYVVRGQVAIGSGSGELMANAVSTTTGQWQQLRGISDTCPAWMTTIEAISPGGAEFYVDEVSVRKTLAAAGC